MIKVMTGIAVAVAIVAGAASPANAIPKCAVQKEPNCRGYMCLKHERCVSLAGWVISGCTRLICTTKQLPFHPPWIPQPGPKIKQDWVK
jgi:hypothetical protein